jgi:hypothetical protein
LRRHYRVDCQMRRLHSAVGVCNAVGVRSKNGTLLDSCHAVAAFREVG